MTVVDEYEECILFLYNTLSHIQRSKLVATSPDSLQLLIFPKRFLIHRLNYIGKLQFSSLIL